MDKVLVFTNKDSWGCISRGIRNRVKWASFPDVSNPVWYVDYQNGEVLLKEVTDLSEEGVYLVYDTIDLQQLKQLFDKYPQDHLYVLIHSKGRKKADLEPWKETYCLEIREGLHVFSSAKFYTPLFDIVTDADGNKLERIIKRIFMPIKEAALELLSECLEPKINLEESNAYLTLCQKEELKPELEAFKKKYDASENYSDYKKDLDRLGNILIG